MPLIKDKIVFLLNCHSNIHLFPWYIRRRLIGIDFIRSTDGKKIIELMFDDPNFKNFLCVNLQGIIKEMWREKKELRNFFEERGDLFHVQYFGFHDSSKFKENQDVTNDEPLSNLFITYFDSFKKAIRELKGTIVFGSQKELIQQYNKFMKIIGYKEDNIIRSKIGPYATFGRPAPKKFQDILTIWQNSIIFEAYIQEMLRRKCKKDEFDIFTNPFIVLEPKNPFESSFEIDCLLYNKIKEKLIFIECKNGKLERNDLYKFIGQTSI